MSTVRVERVCGWGFMGYTEQFQVDIPPTGLVVITGPNGTGKSSVVEAVSVALWGKTLRGTPPWREGEKGLVAADCAGYAAMRTCSEKGRKALQFTGGTQYETATKAQQALEHIAGAWELWRRTSVFSAYDAAHFSQATDGERKRLIEVFVGNQRFDPALEACRDELRATVGRFDRLKHARDTLDSTAQTQRDNLRRAKALMATLTAAAHVDPSEYKRLSQALEGADAQLSVLRTRLSKNTRSEGEHDSTIRRLERQISVLGEGTCSACGQDVPDALLEELRGKLDREREAAKQAGAESAKTRLKMETEARLLQEKVSRLREQRGVERAKLEEAKASAEARQQAEESVAMASEALGSLEEQLEDTSLALELAERDAGVLRACEQVLGLKGVRAHILGNALAGLTDLANYWLGMVAGGDMQVKFSPYAEKSSGGVTDALSMEVTGAGGGHGYRASSGGQRRRIDVAVLLALAELSGGVHNNQDNTLFFDEVFDSLDDAGIDAVVSALQEVSRGRAVVVISHNPRLVASLDAGTAYSTVGGKVAEVTR